MSQLKARLSNAGYGLAMNLLFHPRLSPRAMRRNFELFAATPQARIQRRFPQVRFAELALDGLRVESISAVPDPQRVVLYLHGGGYVFGSIETYRRRAMKLSYRCRAEVVVPDYRLAPEHPYPAALLDALSTWRHLAARDDSRPILLAGDSAGGGLALSLMVVLRDERDALPAGAILLSPWTDLGMSGESMAVNRARDCWLTREQLATWARLYAGDEPVVQPLISPLFANLCGLPPLLLLAGSEEILLDDARRLASRARAAGVTVQEEIGAGMQHDWPLTLPWLAQSQLAWRTIEAFAASTAASSVRTVRHLHTSVDRVPGLA